MNASLMPGREGRGRGRGREGEGGTERSGIMGNEGRKNNDFTVIERFKTQIPTCMST